ncbi:hypothetical protein IE53DRAFT_391101 [Violaceomyces palustris]|uniref:Uncharacterized protein n=1 Tax=Violaceomyces palustris TaxID=1673888 RepID=A0ACD0NLS8_9BASI|nr:hypothetical protein IE53DRAFT_391101 [Violaceomyces palustris]
MSFNSARSSLRKAARSSLISSPSHPSPSSSCSSSSFLSSSSSAPSSSTRIFQTNKSSARQPTSLRRSSSSSTSSSSSSSNNLISSLILSRPPTILREPTAFEKAYFDYNRKIAQTLQQPFPKDFYFKKGSSAEKDFELDLKTNQPGFSKASPSSEKDASLTGSDQDLATSTSEASENDAEAGLYQTLPRTTKADEVNDTRSLERKLDRTLYLLVKNNAGGKDSEWDFPKRKLDLQAKESLHQAAPKAVKESLGKDMDIWMITNSPVGHFNQRDQKTYFMRAHIIAGQPKQANGTDYKWLTKEEVREVFTQAGPAKSSDYWQEVADLLDE